MKTREDPASLPFPLPVSLEDIDSGCESRPSHSSHLSILPRPEHTHRLPCRLSLCHPPTACVWLQLSPRIILHHRAGDCFVRRLDLWGAIVHPHVPLWLVGVTTAFSPCAGMTKLLRHRGVLPDSVSVVSMERKGVGMTAGYFSAIVKVQNSRPRIHCT